MQTSQTGLLEKWATADGDPSETEKQEFPKILALFCEVFQPHLFGGKEKVDCKSSPLEKAWDSTVGLAVLTSKL